MLEEFDTEIKKVAVPIFEKVEKREVHAADGNPSDSKYQEKLKEEKAKTVKMKVINNRKPLKPIPEEKKEEKSPLADDYYVGSSTLDYLDDIFT